MAKTNDSARRTQKEHNRLLVEVGRDYYLRGRSKVEIAADHGLSRFRVADLIQEARDQGVVRITLHVPDDESDSNLANALGLDRVVTVAAETGEQILSVLAQSVADVVARTVSPGDTVGISWSRTLQEAVSHLPSMPTCALVQLSGAIADEQDTQGPRLLAGVQARAVWPLWAPLVVPDAVALRSSPEVQQALTRADDLDVAIIAIGRWKEGFSTVWDRVPPGTRRVASDAGAVAEISGRLIDADGGVVDSPVNDMVVAATLEQMTRARHTIGVAYGAGRAVAVLAAIRAGVINTLVCDLDLHEALTSALSRTSTAPTSS